MKKLVLLMFLVTTLGLIAKENNQLSATIIGSGSPIYNENRLRPSVLITAGKDKILVDMGNGTQDQLNKLNIKSRTLSALLFTHHHLDHNEEFVPIFVQLLMGRNDFTIIGPPGTKEITNLNLKLYNEDLEYRLRKTNRDLDYRKEAFTTKIL